MTTEQAQFSETWAARTELARQYEVRCERPELRSEIRER
jgi:hypothetical protein